MTTPELERNVPDLPIRDWAQALWASEGARQPIAPIRDRATGTTPADAYRVQLEVVKIRAALGHRRVGMKVGLVSRAMQEMAGVFEPDYGHLFAPMQDDDGATIQLDALIAPKIEPEIAFVLDRPLVGPGVTVTDVLRATAYVTPSLEIVDSRIANWNLRWIDTVADNGSSARFVLCERAFLPHGVDFRNLGVTLDKNGAQVANATMAAVLGNPLRAVAWLANKMAEWEISLAAGDIILPGSPVRAIDIARGDRFEAHFTGMGAVSVGFS